MYIDEAGSLANHVQQWFLIVGIHLEAHHVVDVLKQQVSFDTVQYTVSVLFEGVGNALLVLLLVLYLLAEQSTHAPGSLRAKVDSQIQRYVVIKTAISGLQGLLAYFIMGPLLNVRMAHLFGVLHFLLNYIPTAGPIVATVLPLPVVILDPTLSITAKIAAFAGPTAVHMVIGNLMEPIVFGQNMELHPVTVLLALALWYALWGVPGAILAVPITAVLRIILLSMDHPYASIVISTMEGRFTAASEGLGEALDGSTAADVDGGGVTAEFRDAEAGGGGGGGSVLAESGADHSPYDVGSTAAMSSSSLAASGSGRSGSSVTGATLSALPPPRSAAKVAAAPPQQQQQQFERRAQLEPLSLENALRSSSDSGAEDARIAAGAGTGLSTQAR